MRKLLFAGLIGLCFSCSNPDSEPATVDNMANGDMDTTQYTLPYKLDHPNDWSWGEKKHIQTALNSLKAYEEGDIDAAVKGFADTVVVEFDQYEATLSKDSLKALFSRDRAAVKDMQIAMDDWESVISKDKSHEYVSLWYKQIWTDQNGKVDSMEVMDDLRFKEGKIIVLNEKVRRYGKKKNI